jgi:hypothetical protein
MNTLTHFQHPCFMRCLRTAALLGCVLLPCSLASIPAEAQDRPAAHATLFLVRHAEKSAPNGDLPLSAEGRSRAAMLASMLHDTGVGRIYTTEMVRTRETAEPLERAEDEYDRLLILMSEPCFLLSHCGSRPAGCSAPIHGGEACCTRA